MLSAKYVVLFVVAGGAIGGMVTGLGLIVLALWDALTVGYFQPASLFGAVPSLLLTSAIGVVLGLPASLATGVAYVWTARVRGYKRIATVGGASSTLWGAYLSLLASSGSFDPSALVVVLFFAGSGALAATVCHHVARKWMASAALDV